ncbi:MAG TPA: MMPL family transporter [Caldimonas sp.]|jgi:predicted exporter|nr:MMPL family transporter [Caldimonas sp.]HEX2539737.1 MMPL family transporter [Caldimonas sp.]
MTADPPRGRTGVLAVVLWLLGCAVALVVAVRADYVADLSAFLPSAPTAEQAVLLDQVKNGAASRMVFIGIEGGGAAEGATQRAEASRQLAAALRADPRFTSVSNGDTAAWADVGRFVFEHRYALSPAVDAARFEVEGLRSAIDETVSLLGTPAGSLLKPILFRDPTGETLRIAEAMTPAHAPRSENGVWVSRSAPRAVLVATTKADGGDLDGQQAALEAIGAAFARNAAPGLRLQLSGAGKFGVSSRERIRSAVERLALFGSVLVVAFLVVAFASLRSLAIAMLPVATGILAGIAAVSLGFSQVHGMTLGFGTTLIGEAVDYAIYYLIQARPAAGAASDDTPAPAGAARWLRESWPTIRLGLLTSVIGFGALVFSGFPGLAQLGVFSIAGLLAAAATTRFVFPVLAPRGAPGQGLRRQLGRFMQLLSDALPRARWVFLGITFIAAAALAFLPSPWRGELMSLSPIGPTDLALDAALRADVGAPDAGMLVAVSAPDETAALEAAEAVGTRLDQLVRDGVLAGYDSPARFLPSPRTQALRRAALPDEATLTTRLAAATEGGPIPLQRLGPFVADVQAARAQRPVARADLEGTPLGVAVDGLLLRGDGSRPWRALVNLQLPEAGRLDAARVRTALTDVPGARLVAVKAELDAIYDRFLLQAAWQAAAGAVAVLALLGWQLRSARRLGRIVVPIAASTLLVLGALSAGGVAFGILHLVGILLTAAIGSNYALFFDHFREHGRSDSDTLASLLLATLTTVASFGLLAVSGIPVLRAIGEVVAPGALLCLLLSASFIGTASGPPIAHGKIALP